MRLEKRRVTAAAAVLLAATALLLPAAAGTAVAQNNTSLYNQTPAADGEVWLEGREDPDISNVTGMLGRLGTFVVGHDPSDPGAGPIITGMLVAGVVIGIGGTNRAGVTAGAVLGIAAIAVLSQGAGLFPFWLYGATMIVIGLVAAALVVRYLQ